MWRQMRGEEWEVERGETHRGFKPPAMLLLSWFFFFFWSCSSPVLISATNWLSGLRPKESCCSVTLWWGVRVCVCVCVYTCVCVYEYCVEMTQNERDDECFMWVIYSLHSNDIWNTSCNSDEKKLAYFLPLIANEPNFNLTWCPSKQVHTKQPLSLKKIFCLVLNFPLRNLAFVSRC